ncbi:MAG: Ku protein [Bdellovibrio sp.]|nr:Ku protein [Bdellovibrio sp.]
MRASIWKGALSFGLLNIPVRLAKAEEEKNLHFCMLDGKDLAPIKYKKINALTGKEVPYERIVKGHEYKKDEYVVMTDDDFKSANVEATRTIDIENFVDLAEVDPMYLEKPYYLVPEKNAEKGYFLLCEAMKRSKKVAIAKIVMTTKQHLAMIMTRGDYLVLEILRFAHEVLDSDEVDYFNSLKKVKFSSKELNMAMQLIEDMTEKWNPDQYQDTYYDDLKKIIDKKVKGGKGKVIEEHKLPEISRATNVLDLMPLLKASLGKKKKVTHKAVAKRA